MIASCSALLDLLVTFQHSSMISINCDWAKTWQMSFNAGKCSVLTVTKKRTPLLSVYSMLGQTLQHFDHHPYLGVELARDMCWGPHIKKTAQKAQKLPQHAVQEPTWVLRDNEGPRLHHHGQAYPGICKYSLGPLPQHSYQDPGGCSAYSRVPNKSDARKNCNFLIRVSVIK